MLWRGVGPFSIAAGVGADACLLVVADHEEGGELEQLQAEASELGLDVVVEVRDEDELELALERLDPEIFLLTRAADEDGDALDSALELLPDVPAGKLAVADVPVSTRDEVDELERAGVDAVIVRAGNIAELVGHLPPQV
jgi:indole-3-glycerol phosphate synthase